MSREPLNFTSARNRFYIFIQITIAIIAIGSYFYKTPISESEIRKFRAVVKSKPKYVSTASHGHYVILFKISNCDYELQIEDAALEALGDKKQFLNEVSIGDTINVAIRNSDYQSVILRKRRKAPFTGTHINVYELDSKKKKYITLSEYNHYKKKDEYFGVLIGIGLLVLVLITVLKKIPLSTFLEKNWWLMLIAVILTLIYSWYAFKI